MNSFNLTLSRKLFSFISLRIAFIPSFILWPNSTISVSIRSPAFWTLHLIACLSPRLLALFLEFWSVLSFGPYFFGLLHLLCFKVWSFRYSPGQGSCGLYVGKGSEREQCHLPGSCPTFHHSSHFSQVDCALSGADSQVGGFVYILRPHASLQQTLLWDWEFLLLPQHP